MIAYGHPGFTPQQCVYYPPVLVQSEIPWGKILLVLGGAVLGYALLETFAEPEVSRARCGHCGRVHSTRSCPHVAERRHFSSAVEKTGWCECCGYRFRKTQLHHYAGRGDDTKGMEMCSPCHLHCGHNGHTQNFAVKPRYCRFAA